MITVYTQEGCAPCKALKKRFDEWGVPYEEVNVSQSQEAKDLLAFFGIRSVPAVFKDGKQVQITNIKENI